MTPGRAKALVGGTGGIAAALVALGLAVAGGPADARREERDAVRLGHLREIARAFGCDADARPPAAALTEPMGLGALSPACLAPERAKILRDPLTGADYRIEREAGLVRICGTFDGAVRPERQSDTPPFDPATGCVTVTPGQGPA